MENEPIFSCYSREVGIEKLLDDTFFGSVAKFSDKSILV
ncbi:hypothetical protein ELS84_2879 [Enterococcus faecalis]|nr:hypothetical protein ELS84_2879 [Enterococcus faecalis]